MTTPTPASHPPAAVAATTTVPAPRARRERLSAVNGIARQFGGPSGPTGHLVTGLLARGNASFKRKRHDQVPCWSPVQRDHRIPHLGQREQAQPGHCRSPFGGRAWPPPAHP